eukprot:scaffold1595_cov171-Amphora_coffeaeformis.AAC.21
MSNDNERSRSFCVVRHLRNGEDNPAPGIHFILYYQYPAGKSFAMMNRLLLVTFLASGAESFVTRPQTQTFPSSTTTTTTTTSLSALPPPLIIGPMLKKMKEENQKKKMPMADPSEAANEAPGLRVGATAWKWPPIWPYDAEFFVTAKSFEAAQQKKQMSQMTSALTGIAQIPTSDNGLASPNATALTNGAAATQDAQDVLDPLKYWGQDVAQVTTDMDPDAVARLKAHYEFYLQDGISILELGAAEDSYLPDSIKPSRHVGVGANPIMMKKNPSLTETLVVNLNKVVEGRDVDNDDFRRLAQEPFDAVIMANTVDFLTSPREVFRSAWYLLKPGGQMIVAFSGKDGTKDKFPDATTKMWNDFNDDQHLWMTGSFFQFSAGDGWESLRGFDISPDSAKKETEGAMALLDRGKNNNLYVVQAIKGYQDETIDPENAEKSIQSLCWMLPGLEQRDKDLIVPRLARVFETAEDDAIRSAIERNVQKLPSIYEALQKMDRFEFSFTMQAQLATDLVCDPDFGGTEEELLALRQGLGLRKPSEEFWAPIGRLTAKVPVEEKISLLGYMVPCFGSDDPEQERALQDYVS